MSNDVTTMSIEQLKALAYDVLVMAEQAQKNLNLINAEIAKKTKQVVTEETNEENK